MAITPIHDVGSSIGPYRVEELLGRGGMGVVYRATDLRLGRPVALKLLSPELSGDARFRARFERESQLAASIDHAGIIPVYEAGDADGLLYIAMRYVDGSDLAQLLRREGPLEPSRAIELVGQLAEALDAAHARGLIHRDVKPSNVLVAREGPREHVYLADFGLTQTSGPDSVTASGQVVGTVAYMAPEVIRGEQPGAAADVYALGCVLFECLAGEVPFSGSNEAAVIYGHLETPPPSVRDRAAQLPDALDPVIAQALAKDPAERYGSGAAMVADARAALGAAPARRSGRRRSSPVAACRVDRRRSPRRRRRHRRGRLARRRRQDRDHSQRRGGADRSRGALAPCAGGARRPSLGGRRRAGRDLGGGRPERQRLPDRSRHAHDPRHSERRAWPERPRRRPRRRLGRQPPGRHPLADLRRQQRSGRHDHEREPFRRLPARRRRLGRRREPGRGPAMGSGHAARAPHRRRRRPVGSGVRRRRRVGSRR